jgi:cephalosporin-C deacetylase-like acetyl esterase
MIRASIRAGGVLALMIVVLAACSGPAASASATAPASEPVSSPPPTPAADATALTAYDATEPIDLQEAAAPKELDGGVTVHDVSWASPPGGRATAWLVVPDGSGPFAAILYQHGSETDRNDFLDEAVAMAHGGAIGLVVDAPFARRGADRKNFLQYYSLPERERDMTAEAIMDLRRGIDLLVARPDVDPTRIGFVGHSWGASLGVVLAAVDPRPTALVLLSGRPSWTGFLAGTRIASITRTRNRIGEEAWHEYIDAMAPFDAMAEIANVDATRLYLQYGTRDDVVPPDVAQELVDAAVGARTDWYNSGHALDETATADRVAWLVDRLQLGEIGPDIVAEVGLPDQ